MKKLATICGGALLFALAACNAETGSDIYNEPVEREGMETEDGTNVITEEDETMEEKYQSGSDEDPVADSLRGR